MKLASLISGGKDSLYAMYLARKGGHNIDTVVSFISENKESYMFHTQNISMVKNIAELMNVRLVEKFSKGVKEEELEDIKSVLSELKKKEWIEGITTGAVASNYQKQRIDDICKELVLESIAPLWNCDHEKYLRKMLADGFEAIIVSVAAPPLDEKWLGRKLDNKAIDELILLNKKYGISLVGEGGEFDTLVTYCPMYRKRIIIEEAEKIWDTRTRSGVLAITKAGAESS